MDRVYASEISECDVSVLFSEPKIPQLFRQRAFCVGCVSFSALQRAENSSMLGRTAADCGNHKFQCSSASRKFLNATLDPLRPRQTGFSALQRAENSSMRSNRQRAWRTARSFSALQRAENSSITPSTARWLCTRRGFSALQRAENSSIQQTPVEGYIIPAFQCSSASRKFLNIRKRGAL